MLGAPSLGLKIHSLIRATPSSCRLRQIPVTTNWTQAATQHRQREVALSSKEPPAHAPTLPQVIQNPDNVDLGIASDGNAPEESQGNYANATGRHHRRPIGLVYTSVAERTKDERGDLLRIIATTQSPDEAWNAYRIMLTLTIDPAAKVKRLIPYAHFHRLARLLSSTRPRTRTLFLRLLSVLTSLKKEGGTIHTWEWNALIDCAGKGLRKTRSQDYKAALDVFNDMVMQEALEGDGHDKRVTNQEGSEKTAVAKPDIITYTTLLYIASKSGMPATIRHADNLLKLSGMRPNKLTHLALLRYFSRAGKLSGVRSTISRMRDQGLELGIDGINACMTAFMRTSQMDIASTIYRVLRHHVVPELDIGAHDINAAIRYLDVSEGIIIPENIIPDRISYTTVIQGLAYHGDLIQSMQVFVHMLSSPDIEPHAPRAPDEKGELVPVSYPTTLPVFRAFFLGFARHAQSPLPTRQKQNRLRNFNPPSPDSPWTLKNLDVLFESFLEWPVDTQPSDRTIYWILVAFAKTSGNDADKLQKVWSQLRSRFEGRWGGRLERFRKRVHGELPSVDEWEY